MVSLKGIDFRKIRNKQISKLKVCVLVGCKCSYMCHNHTIQISNPKSMARGTELTRSEQRAILELHKTGIRVREISDQIKRSVGAVHKVISRGVVAQAHPRSRRPSKFDERIMRRLVRTVVAEPNSAKTVPSALQLNVSVRTTQLHMQTNLQLNWRSFKRTPPLSIRHRVARMDWALDKAGWSDEKWDSVIFSDEKRWTLDGPNGLKKYWHTVGTTPTIWVLG